MKNVIHVITTIERGGAENQLLVVARAQVQSGRQVTIIPLKGRLELDEEFSSLGAVVNRQLLNKHPVIQVLFLTKIVSKKNFFIHAHLPRAELLVSMIPKRVKFVVTRHNTENFFPRKPEIISRFLSRFVATRSLGVIAISQAVKDFLDSKREIPTKSKVEIIYYGYDTKFLEMRDSKTLLPRSSISHRIIGTIGRLVPQKDYETLLLAFRNYSTASPESTLVILGEGHLESSLKKMADKLDISQKILWVGKSDNVAGYMKEFDLMILTSRYEGFGFVLLEAMLSRIPVIASRNSAIPEVLGEEHPGLCQTGNSEEFASRLLEFESKERISEIIKFQDERIANFDPEIMRQKLDSFYELE